MKKFFSNILLLLSVLLVSIIAVPLNNISQWGFELAFLTDNEVMIKGIIGALIVVIGLVFLFVSNKEYKENGTVSNSTRNLAVLPIFAFALASMVFTTYLAYVVYIEGTQTLTQLLILGGSAGVILTLFLLFYILIIEYKNSSNLGRFIRSIFLVVLAGGTAVLSYWQLHYRVGNDYAGMNTKLMIIAVPVLIVLYVVYLILSSLTQKSKAVEESLEKEINENRKTKPALESQTKNENKKAMIVSKEQNIVTGRENVDPTSIIFQDVDVDPEFSKIASQSNQANSIEYYIEKPKMFKPLDPSFDELVSYVRELPQVVTKLDDDRITFYVDRKPFLVLMNFGNYYRLAFKYDLEQGIRLIIKYPTISKNKSTKDELWFKANNYGDIPKDVIYSIVKTAHSNYNT